ncbi:chemotaxis protein CheW [Cognatilysobacter segetis]|uniref:chemotaxis protein CheW n=1 Tax=Cognatilysobacter segetis TaxID=2492394 RepID=UPI001EE3AFF0|nr:chemotaxis protein CheW [Lysobacter segetis]
MSKKKRNRRPAVAMPASGARIAEAAIETPEADVEADAASPVVDVALAQAVAMTQVGTDASPALQPAPAIGVQAAWTAQESGDIRGVLIQVGGGRLLLPNATIAEVLSYAEPEREASGADWLLGRMRWRGWQLPLVAFSRLAGIGEDTPGLGSKVIVLKALGGDRRLPFFAVVTQGFPRLVTVSKAALSIESQDAPLPRGVQALVRLNDEPALLPDLLQIEQQLHELRDAA